jgi:hypothetical protein
MRLVFSQILSSRSCPHGNLLLLRHIALHILLTGATCNFSSPVSRSAKFSLPSTWCPVLRKEVFHLLITVNHALSSTSVKARERESETSSNSFAGCSLALSRSDDCHRITFHRAAHLTFYLSKYFFQIYHCRLHAFFPSSTNKRSLAMPSLARRLLGKSKSVNIRGRRERERKGAQWCRQFTANAELELNRFSFILHDG